MAKTADQLIQVLTEKQGALFELLRILEEERRCIVASDVANLEIVVDRKRELGDRLQRAAALARQQIVKLAAEQGLAGADRLSLVIAGVQAPEREALQRLQETVLELGGAVKEAERHNKELLDGALLTVNRCLDFFGRVFSRSTTYGEGGRLVGGTASARLVRREA